MLKKNIFFLYFFFLAIINLKSYSSEIERTYDSLLQIIKTSKQDTVLYSSYIELGEWFKSANSDSAFYYYKKAYEKARDLKDKVREAEALSKTGICYYFISDYNEALKNLNQAISILEELLIQNKLTGKNKVKNILTISYNNLGNVYSEEGDYARALDNYFKSLKIAEEINDKKRQAINLGNIGTVYDEQKEYEKALHYYGKALKIAQELNDKKRQASIMSNIGIVHMYQNKFPEALKYFTSSLILLEELGDKKRKASVLNNIGNLYSLMNEDDKAIDYFKQSLILFEEINNKKSYSLCLGNIGASYLKQKNYKEAEKYLHNAIEIGEKIKYIYGLKDFYESLSKLYEETGNFKNSLKYYKKHIIYRDSVQSEENKKALVQKEMEYYF